VCPVRKGDDLVIEVRYLRKMIDGVPVMATPPEIDVTTAEQLRAVLLAATENRYRTLVVDMTRTRFCDSAAVHALIAAHKRVLAEGGGLRLVVPADGAVHRVLTLPGIDHFIRCFASLEEAVAPMPWALGIWAFSAGGAGLLVLVTLGSFRSGTCWGPACRAGQRPVPRAGGRVFLGSF
jgi:anti-sigma B factor antagonist